MIKVIYRMGGGGGEGGGREKATRVLGARITRVIIQNRSRTFPSNVHAGQLA